LAKRALSEPIGQSQSDKSNPTRNERGEFESNRGASGRQDQGSEKGSPGQPSKKKKGSEGSEGMEEEEQ